MVEICAQHNVRCYQEWLCPKCVDDADEAYDYLSRLFKNLAPQCKPLPTLPGLATQIDNYIAGQHQKNEAYKEMIKKLIYEVQNLMDTVNSQMLERELNKT